VDIVSSVKIHKMHENLVSTKINLVMVYSGLSSAHPWTLRCLFVICKLYIILSLFIYFRYCWLQTWEVQMWLKWCFTFKTW